MQLSLWLEHHAGGYAPRQPARKLRGLSYSRCVMAVHMPHADGQDQDVGVRVPKAVVGDGDGTSSGQQQPLNQQPASFAFDSRCGLYKTDLLCAM